MFLDSKGFFMKQYIYQFLSSGTSPSEPVVMRQMITAHGFLIITAAMCFVAIFLNLWLTRTPLVALLDAIAFGISVVALIDLHRHRGIKRSVIVGVGNLFILLITFVILSQSNEFGLIWTIFFPIFTIPLIGHRKGLALSTVFYLILFGMANQGIGVWDYGTWNFKSFLRLFLASTVLSYLIYVYERALEHTNRELDKIRAQEAKNREELQRISITDPLTKLYNRRRIMEVLEENTYHTQRNGDLFSVILFDIDDFKHVNDRYGHNVGDQVLVAVAERTQDSVRKTDIVGRWGGEEFLVILQKTSVTHAIDTAEKIRGAIQTILFDEGFQVTCSFGVAEYYETMTINEVVKYQIESDNNFMDKRQVNIF